MDSNPFDLLRPKKPKKFEDKIKNDGESSGRDLNAQEIRDWKPMDKNLKILNNGEAVIGIRYNEKFCFHGRIQALPLSGSIECLGVRLSAGSTKRFFPFYSPATHSFVSIGVSRLEDPQSSILTHDYPIEDMQGFDAIIALKSMCDFDGLDALSQMIPNLKVFDKVDLSRSSLSYQETEKKFEIPGLYLLEKAQNIDHTSPHGFNEIKVPQDWRFLANNLSKLAEGKLKPIILICGNRNQGKSTFCRLLLNQMLHEYDQNVAYLETDLGQSEFSPPGQISLHLLKYPNIGPPFCHLQRPIFSHFYGHASADKNPFLYFSCIISVFSFYQRYFAGKVPLVINTQGWITGLGLDLLIQIIQLCKPNYIVQMMEFLGEDEPDFKCRRNLPNLFELGIKEEARTRWMYRRRKRALMRSMKEPWDLKIHYLKSAEKILPVRPRKYSREIRDLSLLTYFLSGRTEVELNENLSDNSNPVVWDTNLVNPDLVNILKIPYDSISFSFHSGQISRHMILRAVDKTLVAIVKGPKKSDKNNKASYFPRLTSFPQPRDDSNFEHGQLIGYGIARSLDEAGEPFDKVIHLQTPIKKEELASMDHEVILCRGSINVPLAMLHDGSEDNSAYVEKYAVEGIYADSSKKVRRNLLRKSVDN